MHKIIITTVVSVNMDCKRNPTMIYVFIALILLVITCCRCAVGEECSGLDPPLVSLSAGCVEGTVNKSLNGRTFYSFRGIPYAAPPVGPLRFRAPQPPMSWYGILPAVNNAPCCLEPMCFKTEVTKDEPHSEDCLYLNVYTPYLQHPTGNRMAVHVFVYGGKFFMRSASSLHYGPEFQMDKDVVLVLMNYRLGVFGYLNMNITEAQGNAALKDVIEALRWVQKEIANFGGDPDKVTLDGSSSGSAVVSHLYASPMAQGLFHQAIIESGSALSFWSFQKSTGHFAKELGASLGCSTDNAQLLTSCLQSIDGNVLAQRQYMLYYLNSGLEIPFVPSLEYDHGEEVCLPDYPKNLISNVNSGVPLLIGFNSAEGLVLFTEIDVDAGQTEFNFTLLLEDEIVNKGATFLEEIMGRVKDFYLGDNSTPTSRDISIAYLTFIGDYIFNHDTLRNAQMLSRQAPVFLYYFNYVGECQKTGCPYPEFNTIGASHATQLAYLFFNFSPLWNETAYDRERAMISTMTTLWSNFITYGNPAPCGNEFNVTWKTMDQEFTRHMVIDDTLEMVDAPLIKDRMDFMDELYTFINAQDQSDHGFKYSAVFLVLFVCLVTIPALSVCICTLRKHGSYIPL